jgi:hypothetical protein
MSKQETTYVEMGMAALLPGMQYLIDRMQEQLDEFKRQLAELQNGRVPEVKADARRGPGRPKTVVSEQRTSAERGGWSNDPEERKREMARRRRRWGVQVPEKKARKLGRPKASAYQKTQEAMSTGQKKYWDSLTPGERKARIEKMIRARTIKGQRALGATA